MGLQSVSCAGTIMSSSPILLSVIIPVFNEASGIPALYQRLITTIPSITEDFEILWVNDSSTDDTLSILKGLAAKDSRNRFISLSRNFGHQRAITAGIDKCKGKAAVIMDGDGQDPPELIPELWAKYSEGFKVVYAQRRKRAGESMFKKATATFFYRLLKRTAHIDIPLDTGDFRLIDRRIIEHLKEMPEQNKFIRGQIAWIGFRQTSVLYDRKERAHGQTNFSTFKMLRFALDGITAFSNYPLRVVTMTGFAVSLLSFLIILYALYSKFIRHEVITGWTSLIISTMFIGGVQLIAIGIIGQYISRINSDVRKRPLYIVDEEN
jgi:polyisoprenyl-phosphate glycosyltransferase